MDLHIDVCWPVKATIPLPDSEDFADGLRNLALRTDLLHHDGAENRLYIRGLFNCMNKVPDVDRYRIRRDTCTNDFAIVGHDIAADGDYLATYPYVDLSTEVAPTMRTLVLLLESPHRDEFGASVSVPIAPARGATGEGIDRHMGRLIRTCPQLLQLLQCSLPVRVIIANPIPLQTSAYAVHRGRLRNWQGLRDRIWSQLWNLEDCGSSPVIQRDFLSRVARYNPVAIVNACTHKFRPKVKELLLGNGYDANCLFETHHPSRWHQQTRISHEP